MLCYLFCCLNCYCLAIGSSFTFVDWFVCPFDYFILFVVVVLSTSLLSGNKVLQAHVILCLPPISELIISVMCLGFFYWKIVFTNQDLVLSVGCYWNIIASRSSKQTELGDMCTNLYLCTNLSLCVCLCVYRDNFDFIMVSSTLIQCHT